MQIANTGMEKQITLDDAKPFLSKQDVPANDTVTPGYTLEGPHGSLIGISAGTNWAPEFRDSNGNKLDSSTRVTIQKCDKQGNPLGGGVVATALLGDFNYAKMRSDPDYMRKTSRDLLVGERQIAKVFIDIPDGANGFDAGNSRLTIGDTTSDFGKAVEFVDVDDLAPQQQAALKAAQR